ncbi:hypothetical protein VB796_23305 [Arcicella sp. LKC2W]|uniref:DUF3846 domain-containing protein n=1 Tax=Arcicella sp. LKC2W TaxID=2984198 RepID=UPI002B1E9EFD|nr:hypothetical protein [Arcicella sp. LKC2W]MEA5462018.1 hypothetical protein [Arcicella sp. LKC2W]
MAKKIKALFIDVVKQTVTSIEIKNKFSEYYPLLECQIIEPIYLENSDVIYIDEEGLLCEQEGYFRLKGYPQVYAGHGLVIGTELNKQNEKDDGNCLSTLQDILNLITFLRPDEVSGDDIEPFFDFIPYN